MKNLKAIFVGVLFLGLAGFAHAAEPVRAICSNSDGSFRVQYDYSEQAGGLSATYFIEGVEYDGSMFSHFDSNTVNISEYDMNGYTYETYQVTRTIKTKDGSPAILWQNVHTDTITQRLQCNAVFPAPYNQ